MNKAIKFAFVQIGNQHGTIWLHQAVKKCADHGFMVDVHDEYRSTGFSTCAYCFLQEKYHKYHSQTNFFIFSD